MATITRTRDGVTTTTDAGESLSEFSSRLKREREQKALAKKVGGRVETIGGKDVILKVTEAPIVARDSSGKGYTATDLLIDKNKSLLQSQPKGSYKVTKADGSVVYRTSGTSATGRYVKDVYQRLQEEKNIQTIQGQYKSIPKSAKKVTTKEGDVYRLFLKKDGKTFVTDYKPGGIKETKVLTKTFIGGSSQFLPKQEKEKPTFSLPPTPVIDFSLKQKPLTAKSGSGYEARIKKLVEREENLSRTKEKVFKALRITGKPDAKFYNVFEIGKAVARVPFEIASLPVFIGGRASFIGESIFQKAGREELLRGLKATPSAVREVFVSKDTETGKYKLTAQNVANIGLVGLSVRGVAKSSSNVGLKVYEKYAKTNIKGTIKGYQGTTVFKSAGKFKGRSYKELTVFKGKSSTSTIQYQGKTFIIKRGPSGAGTYKILKTTTKLKINLKKLGKPKVNVIKGSNKLRIEKTSAKRIGLEKETVVLKSGKFKTGDKPIEFKAEKGITTQDIQFLDQRALSKTYINYLEQLKTQAKATGQIKSGQQQLKFDAKADINVKGDIKGIISNQKVFIDKVDFTTPKITITREFNKPIIKFAKKPVYPKDVIIAEVFKEGKAITGYRKGSIVQPKDFLIGTKDAFVKGEFTITGGKGFNVFKNIKGTKTTKPSIINKDLLIGQRVKPTTIFETSKTIGRPISKETTFDFSKSILSKSKPGQQIALTESILAESRPVYTIPFKTQAPKLEFSSLNFEVINTPLGSVKSVPLIPKVTPITTPLKSLNIFKPVFSEQPPKTIIKTFQEVRPTNAFKVTSVIEQISSQKPIVDVKVGQRGKTSAIQTQTQSQISSEVQIQKQVSKQETTFQNVFKQTPITSTFQISQPFKLQIPRIGGFPKPDFGKAPTQEGFNVFTRIKGVFKQANIKPLSKQDAINFGAVRVGTTSQATFKIGKANGEVQDVFRGIGNLSDFYKKDDLFIEKRERRIKSVGELQEITFKGIQSRKTKNIFGGKK